MSGNGRRGGGRSITRVLPTVFEGPARGTTRTCGRVVIEESALSGFFREVLGAGGGDAAEILLTGRTGGNLQRAWVWPRLAETVRAEEAAAVPASTSRGEINGLVEDAVERDAGNRGCVAGGRIGGSRG